ncbi:DUF6273 domain-containing protein [Adlercreutzia sp. ZJ141]|uniref:DUF6273 domain-containing protein n=1 Tax=Adlercreutzia sp. ZJ141 TaxID=2709406 RepID=UPI0013EDF777|nr:DUF6273 domain-containing protein [Adlercreutzia sp. ZJ141]
MGFVCDICGGNDVMKVDGAFTCLGCGVRYSAEEVRKIVLGRDASATSTPTSSPSGVAVGNVSENAVTATPSRIGQTVQFGRFVQDASDDAVAGQVAASRTASIAAAKKESASFEPEPIEWTIVAEGADCELLLATHALAARAYNLDNDVVTWETCGVRVWLNGKFLDSAFTDDEQALMVCADVENPDNAGYGTSGGAHTSDKVFVLSVDEAKRLLVTDDARLCRPTRHAKATGAWENEMGYTRWWLRSPGFMQNMAAYVDTNGEVQCQGIFVDNAGCTVRPAIWLRKRS